MIFNTVYCHPAYLTYMQRTSYEMQGWMNHKLESRFPGEIATTSEKAMAPHSSILPGKSHEWRGLVGCSPWGRQELDD